MTENSMMHMSHTRASSKIRKDKDGKTKCIVHLKIESMNTKTISKPKQTPKVLISKFPTEFELRNFSQIHSDVFSTIPV